MRYAPGEFRWPTFRSKASNTVFGRRRTSSALWTASSISTHEFLVLNWLKLSSRCKSTISGKRDYPQITQITQIRGDPRNHKNEHQLPSVFSLNFRGTPALVRA